MNSDSVLWLVTITNIAHVSIATMYNVCKIKSMLRSVNHKFCCWHFNADEPFSSILKFILKEKPVKSNESVSAQELKIGEAKTGVEESKRNGFHLNTLYPHYFHSFVNAMLCTFLSDQSIFVANWLQSFWSKP